MNIIYVKKNYLYKYFVRFSFPQTFADEATRSIVIVFVSVHSMFRGLSPSGWPPSLIIALWGKLIALGDLCIWTGEMLRNRHHHRSSGHCKISIMIAAAALSLRPSSLSRVSPSNQRLMVENNGRGWVEWKASATIINNSERVDRTREVFERFGAVVSMNFFLFTNLKDV